MKIKDRIKTYNFWISLASAIFLIINAIGSKFNFKLDESIFSDIFTAICGILVLLGILVPPSNPKSLEQKNKEFLENASEDLLETENKNDAETDSEKTQNESEDNKNLINFNENKEIFIKDLSFEDKNLNQENSSLTEINEMTQSAENINENILTENLKSNENEGNVNDNFSVVCQNEVSLAKNEIKDNFTNFLREQRNNFDQETYVQLLKSEIDELNKIN